MSIFDSQREVPSVPVVCKAPAGAKSAVALYYRDKDESEDISLMDKAQPPGRFVGSLGFVSPGN